MAESALNSGRCVPIPGTAWRSPHALTPDNGAVELIQPSAHIPQNRDGLRSVNMLYVTGLGVDVAEPLHTLHGHSHGQRNTFLTDLLNCIMGCMQTMKSFSFSRTLFMLFAFTYNSVHIKSVSDLRPKHPPAAITIQLAPQPPSGRLSRHPPSLSRHPARLPQVLTRLVAPCPAAAGSFSSSKPRLASSRE